MEQKTLEAILDIEEAIRQQLKVEQERAGQWLERARSEIEQERLAELARLEESMTQLEQTAQKAAQEKAAAIVREATAAARQSERYEDTHLTQIVCQHIAGIAPGN